MRLHPGNGIWEIFVPGADHGAFTSSKSTIAMAAVADED